ncbi:MAG: hypothetical protein M1508_07490 [Nitrospirae bacterium]|nr:hypothetical protein [Nitrospirota bacterium]MCL5423290.1 hypothetical protein [Nitrospirota bacterium]
MAAEDAQTEKRLKLAGYLMMDAYSSYVDKVSGETIHNKPVIHPNLLVEAKPWGVYLSVGIYHNLKGFDSHSANSLEYAIGIEKEIGIFRIGAGYGYSDIKTSKGDVHYFYSTIEFPEMFNKLTPYAAVELDLPAKKEVLKGGFMYRAGAKYPVKLSGQAIDIDLSLAGHDGIYGYRPEKISSARLTLSTLIKLWRMEITPEINFQKRLGYSSNSGGIAKDRIYGAIRMALPFNIL